MILRNQNKFVNANINGGHTMKKSTGIRAAVGVVSLALALTACGGSSDSSAGKKGGTLTFITEAEQIAHLDPQRNYTGEDLAFASGYLNRTLTQYTLSADNNEASKLVADLATDTGSTPDGGKTWVFTIRDGVKWEDGQAVTCEDVKYGVSRSFADTVITDGPTYALEMLDIPADAEGNSIFKGPYVEDAAGQAAYDAAVTCEGSKLTFHLNAASADFNATVTLSAFAPVRKDADTGEKYDDRPLSNGPYKIESYVKKDKLVLVRNENWDPATDSYRAALPDRIEYIFSIPQAVITERLMADSGDDQYAISPDPVDSAKLASVFSDAKYEKRRWNELDPYVRYYAINTTKVPNEKHRQAIVAAVNREELRKIAGGDYAGEYADGVIKPNIGMDYTPTGLWDSLLGDKIPATGNPELAKKLIADSGEAFPNPLVIDYPKSETNDKAVASIVASLEAVGITGQPNPIEQGKYYPTVMKLANQGGMTASGWGPDWANASSVIPPIYLPGSSFALSRYDAAGWADRINTAKTLTDRAAQAKEWQAINTEAARLGLVLPTRFGLEQRIAGSKVTGGYIWGPYGSWPYASLGVKSSK